jgi:hypothetical protein
MEKYKFAEDRYASMNPMVYNDRGGDPNMTAGIYCDGSIMQMEDLLQDHYIVKPPFHVRIHAGRFTHREMRCVLSIRTRDHQVAILDYRKVIKELPSKKMLLKTWLEALSNMDAMCSQASAAIQARIEEGITEIDYDTLQNNEKIKQLAIPVVYDVDSALILHSTWHTGNTNVGLSTKPFEKPDNVCILGAGFAQGDGNGEMLSSLDFSASDDSLYANAEAEVLSNPVRAMQLARDCFSDTADVAIRLGAIFGSFYKRSFPEDFTQAKESAIILG